VKPTVKKPPREEREQRNPNGPLCVEQNSERRIVPTQAPEGAEMAIVDFKGTQPEFLPEEFFAGRLEGWAVLESLVGGLQKRATITAEGSWDAQSQTVTFTETYSFDDGHKDTLRWAIKKLAPGKYSGTEPRLDGQAEGEQAGCAYHWRYSRDTPQADGSSTRLNFDDWFYRIDATACIVRGTAGRAGLPFTTAHVTYRKIAN
jgi:Protein of unknown function (DUF3833)